MLSQTLQDGLNDYAIGAKIRALRLKKKIGLIDLGGHTGLSPALLSKIERGKLFPTLPTTFLPSTFLPATRKRRHTHAVRCCRKRRSGARWMPSFRIRLRNVLGFNEKDGATIGELEAADLRGTRVRERAALAAEQFAFHQRRWQRCAVHVDQTRSAPGAETMDLLGGESFPVPVSPRSRTVALVGATCARRNCA